MSLDGLGGTSNTSIKGQFRASSNRSSSILEMRFLTFVLTTVLLQVASAFPHFSERGRDLISRLEHCNDGVQTPRLFVVPPQITNTEAKKIPGMWPCFEGQSLMSLIVRRVDNEHPYIAPGPNDIRGPCPMLNTLANHGYINRRCVRVYRYKRNIFSNNSGTQRRRYWREHHSGSDGGSQPREKLHRPLCRPRDREYHFQRLMP